MTKEASIPGTTMEDMASLLGLEEVYQHMEALVQKHVIEKHPVDSQEDLVQIMGMVAFLYEALAEERTQNLFCAPVAFAGNVMGFTFDEWMTQVGKVLVDDSATDGDRENAEDEVQKMHLRLLLTEGVHPEGCPCGEHGATDA